MTAIAFFTAVALALANLAFDVICPNVIKRFESPNDLYSTMLEMAERSHSIYPSDDFKADFAHCSAKFETDRVRARPARALSGYLFALAAAGVAVLLVNRSYIVVSSI